MSLSLRNADNADVKDTTDEWHTSDEEIVSSSPVFLSNNVKEKTKVRFDDSSISSILQVISNGYS